MLRSQREPQTRVAGNDIDRDQTIDSDRFGVQGQVRASRLLPEGSTSQSAPDPTAAESYVLLDESADLGSPQRPIWTKDRLTGVTGGLRRAPAEWDEFETPHRNQEPGEEEHLGPKAKAATQRSIAAQAAESRRLCTQQDLPAGCSDHSDRGAAVDACLEKYEEHYLCKTWGEAKWSIPREHIEASGSNGSGPAPSEVVTEISRIQQVLHLDFVKAPASRCDRVLHEEPCRKMISRARQAPKASVSDLGTASVPASRRFRDFFAQTDPLPQKEAHCQTETSLYLEMDRPRKRESRHSNQPMLEEAKTQNFGGGEEHFKEKAREAAMKPPYSVFDEYYETGCAQAIARSACFEYVTLLIVFLNACWMAIDMDFNKADIITDSHPVFLIVENAFCTYFFLELLIRFFAFQQKCHCLQDFWFVLDLILMFLYVLDTWLVMILVLAGGIEIGSGASMMTILRMLRMAKLCRLTRLARLLRAVPELVIIVKGIGFASRSVAIFFVFWTMITYAFAIAIRQLTENTDVGDLYFKSVPEAMNTLLLQGLFPESIDLLAAISGGETWYLWPLTVFFLAVVSLTVMYMLVGVLVEVVQVVASVEKESLSVTFMATELRRILNKMGWEDDQPISKSEFQQLIVEPPIARIIHAVGVDVMTLCEMLDLIFEEVEREGWTGMPFSMLIESILSLRGSNPARVKDVVEQLKMFKIILHERHENLMKKLKREFERINRDMNDVKEDVKEIREAEVREKQMRLLQPPDSSDD
ncbi:Potassium voltage-gated channel subfamily A member 5 (Voltage-gated potassium channel subunit Kv1.5) [Durusdinium trenchii]|uniref:Potassium voltage-gated channel subfamily A member 5 (Voltage-gated potassium channel subunit Kv1.5) n=1 Tax=Durusdinium trenchii TaxID=1381693 RepID=A0ABP0H8L2_9DINO